MSIRQPFPMLLALLALLLGGILPSPAQAQRPKPVSITATLTPDPVHSGEIVTVTLEAEIKPEYHIYSIVPVENGPIPTTLTVEVEGLEPAGEVSESAPEVKYDKNFQTNLGSHYGKATFSRQFRVKGDAPAKLTLPVALRYQACTETSCLPPTTIEAEVELRVEAGAVRPEFAEPSAPTASTPAPSASTAPVTAAPVTAAPADPGDGGLAGFALAGFAAGLLALLTPCVFPMIPVTFAFFTKQAANTGVSLVKLAAVYCLGIILTFTALGAVLAVTVGAAGANRLAANPWVNLVFAAIFILFGLALLEVFEIRLPTRLMSLTGKGRETGGTLGVFFLGLTFVIAAFTCTAPFIGTVLVAAASAGSGGAWIRPVIGMASFASALALPFFLIALFPGLLAKMPKSGSWLTTVKGVMGWIEIGAAFKFLSNTDLVWQWEILTRPMLLALWTLTALAAAAWLLGYLQVGFNTPTGRPTVGRALGAGLFVGFAVYCLIGLTGRPLPGMEGSFLPSANYGYGKSGENELLPPDHKNDLEGGLAEAREKNMPVFLDFTGYTCGNCRWMEENIFVTPAVRQEFQNFVRVVLYTDEEKQKGPDGRALGPKFQDYQQENFGTISQPLYAVLTPEGKPVLGDNGKPLTFAYDTDPAKFVAFLEEGRKRALEMAR